jgi:hypothetical protein
MVMGCSGGSCRARLGAERDARSSVVQRGHPLALVVGTRQQPPQIEVLEVRRGEVDLQQGLPESPLGRHGGLQALELVQTPEGRS